LKRETIVERAKEYINKLPKKEFIPGETYIQTSGQVFDGDDVASVVDVALGMWYADGEHAKEFEKDLRNFYKNTIRHVVLTNSGSSANLLAVTAITDKTFGQRRANSEDEIITVAAGFPTTVNPILQNNLIPVFVDVSLEGFVPDVDVIENAIIEGRTKGIVLAHPLGNPFDADTIRGICDEYGIWFIEDTCDGLGGTLHNKMLGSFGDVSTLSHYPAHHITSGEGGSLLIQSPMVEKVIESYRDWGRDCWCEPGKDNTCGKRFGWKLGDLPECYDHKYTYSRIGYNLKATDFQAALLVSQLKKLPKFIEARRRNWKLLREGLDKYSRYFRFMSPIKGADPSWFGFAITVKPSASFSRNELIPYLESRKVGTRLMFGGNLLRQPAYRDIPHKIFGDDLIHSDIIMRDSLWIGVYPGITDEMIEYTLSVFDDFVESRKRG
jgi:CDP-4-dehydro-6-deoxyglucose reductase, E1